MKRYKVVVGSKTYFLRARDSVDAVKRLQDRSISDDRLSPMTYRKLKEYGYTPQQWKNWTQEQANKVIASRQNKTQKQPAGNNEKQASSGQGKAVTGSKLAGKKNLVEAGKSSGNAPKSFGEMDREQIVDYFSGDKGEELVNKLDNKTKDIANRYYDGDTERATDRIQREILKKSGHKASEFGEDTYSGGLLLMFDDPQSSLYEGDSKRLDFFKAGLEYLGMGYKKLSQKQQNIAKSNRNSREEKESLRETNDLDVLNKYLNSEENLLREYIAGNKNASEEMLRKLSKDKSGNVRREVAGNTSASPKILAKLFSEGSEGINRQLAGNTSTPPEILEKLSTDENYFIRGDVAENKNTPPEILKKLANDEERYVRVNVMENPNTPKSVVVGLLESLSKDNNEYLRASIAENPYTPLKVLKKLSEDKDKNVKKAAIKALNKRKGGKQ